MEVLLKILVILGICLILGFITLLFSKITLCLKLSKESGKKTILNFEISIFGKTVNIKNKKKTHVKKKEESKKEPYDDMGFFEKTKLWYNNFLIFKEVYKKNSAKIRRTIHATKIHLDLSFGTGDAAKTGILTGAVWTGIYNVVAFISRFIRITEPKINVNPEFNARLCSFTGECIIKARVVNLIRVVVNIGISYYFTRKKYKNIKRKGGE